MRPECWILIWLMVPVNVQARDPFRPPQTVCVDMPAEWHYRGLLDRGVACTAIVQGPAGKWYRVQTGGRLPGDLHIVAITRKVLLVKPADSCTGKTLRWEYQERVDEGSQRVAITTGAVTQRVSTVGQPSFTDGRRRSGHSGASGAGRK